MLLTAIAALVFAFPGGGEVEYVNEIARTFEEDVVLFAHGNRSWPKSTLKDNRESNLRRRILSSFGYRGTADQEWAISPKSWPLHFAHKQNTSIYQERFASRGIAPVKDSELVSLGPSVYERVEMPKPYPPMRMPRGYGLAELRALKLDKPVEWHWYFGEAVFLINVRNCPKEKFWKLVTRAVGGKWVVERNRYFIDVDLKEFRERWHAFTAPDTARLSKMFRIKVPLTALSFDLLTDKELKDLLSSRDNTVEREIKPGTSLAAEARKVIEDARVSGSPQLQQFLETELTDRTLIKVVIHSYKTGAVKVYSRDGTHKWVF